MRLVTIVSESDSADSADTLFGFSKQLGRSAWWHRIAPEYGLTIMTSVAEITGPRLEQDVTDHDVFEYITAAVDANGGPSKDGNTLYVLYLPHGVTLIADGVPNTDCNNLGGYHARYGSRGDNLAVIQRCLADLRDATVAASHEVIEAATDPDYSGYTLPSIGREPWTDDIWNAYRSTGRAEVADLCEGTYYVEGEWLFQRVWSNAAAASGGDPCIPELHEPFYDTTFERDWYPIRAGESVTIPFEGWATEAVPDWGLRVHVHPEVAYKAAPSAPTLNSGERASIVVTAPPDAKSGSFAILDVESTRPEGSALTDGEHINFVGVYVP